MVMAYDNAQRRHDGTITFCCASKQFLKFEEPALVRRNKTPSFWHAHQEHHLIRFRSEMSVSAQEQTLHSFPAVVRFTRRKPTTASTTLSQHREGKRCTTQR